MSAIRALPISDGNIISDDDLIGYIVAYRESSNDPKDDSFFYYQSLLFCALNNLDVKYKVVDGGDMVHWSFPHIASETAKQCQETGTYLADPWLFLSIQTP